MSKIKARGGTTATDNSDWNHAWSLVSQLAAARDTVLRAFNREDAGGYSARAMVASRLHGPDLDRDGCSDSKRAHTKRVDSLFDAGTGQAGSFAPIAPDQLARDMAEIERAAAALRRAEPALEPHVPDLSTPIAEPRTARSIWLLVGAIWLTAAAVVSCAIGTIALLLS